MIDKFFHWFFIGLVVMSLIALVGLWIGDDTIQDKVLYSFINMINITFSFMMSMVTVED